MIRSPIVAVLGHVDHGKTTLLDRIRGTAIAKKEAGKITQMIGASYIKKETIEDLTKNINLKVEVKVPGILFIDTPGHEAFTNLRERGGSIADIAVLVIDINQGIEKQTIESIDILKQFKTPFIIAANKIDLIRGWKKTNELSVGKALAKQKEDTKQILETKLYEIVGKLAEYGFESERYDRVRDFTKEIIIVPVSAKTKEGLSEMLLFITGLTQKFMGKNLEVKNKQGKGSIIEVKEVKGIGKTIDVILYDGMLKKGDEVIFAGKEGVEKQKVKGIIIAGQEGTYKYVDEIHAAAGIRLVGKFENAIAGSPLIVSKDYEKEKEELSKEVNKIIFEGEKEGVIVKADTLGSLEALLRLLKERGIPVRNADVGEINKKDIIEAFSVKNENPYLGAILAFNTKITSEAEKEAEDKDIKIINRKIIYRVIEEYEDYVKELKENIEKEIDKILTRPSKIRLMRGCFFRISKPAIVGVHIEVGKIKPGMKLMKKTGDIIGTIKGIQENKESIPFAEKGKEVAISVDYLNLQKDVKEEEIVYSYLTKEEIAKWKEYERLLTDEEKEVLSEIRRIHIRKKHEQ